MTFGVPVSHFPIGNDKGDLKTAAHIKWMARRSVKETALQSTGIFEGIDLPCSRDVLLGRGKTIQDHSGNVMLRDLITEYMPEYRRTPKKEKGNVSWKVVMAAKMLGGRFLKREENGWWVEVPDEIARDKISMSYRTSRRASSMTIPARSSNVLPPPNVHSASYDLSPPTFLEPPLKRCKKQGPGGEERPLQQGEASPPPTEEEQEGVVNYAAPGNKASQSTYNDFCFGA
jgi:hypothetical protein